MWSRHFRWKSTQSTVTWVPVKHWLTRQSHLNDLVVDYQRTHKSEDYPKHHGQDTGHREARSHLGPVQRHVAACARCLCPGLLMSRFVYVRREERLNQADSLPGTSATVSASNYVSLTDSLLTLQRLFILWSIMLTCRCCPPPIYAATLSADHASSVPRILGSVVPANSTHTHRFSHIERICLIPRLRENTKTSVWMMHYRSKSCIQNYTQEQ